MKWYKTGPLAVTARCVSPDELTSDDINAWQNILSEVPKLRSPYLSPGWAKLVGRSQSNAKVVILEKNSQPVGFLPVQKNNNIAAMPLGGPICDYQCFIAQNDTQFDPRMALDVLGVKRIDFTNLTDGHACCVPHIKSNDQGMVVDVSNGWEAYRENRREAGSNVLKRTRKKFRKMKAECPDVKFEAFTHNREDFETLMQWKRDQWKRTQSIDVMTKPWISQVISDSFDVSDGGFGGELFTLKADGELVAALYALKLDKVLHAWFVGYSRDYEAYSPGLILFTETLQAIAEAGYELLDLGGGEYRFKNSLATQTRISGPGFVGSTNLATFSRSLQYKMRSTIEALPLGPASDWPAKAMRRMDVWRGMKNTNA
ncbi:GNAT family N-acetyltransferase [Hirschia maritima]|uniref:GNAT family N-acetyltransferase n=1 Tax=Hirschia maritima TaxID=1121961 RepID=UPI0003788FC2|nr:GNAT family N-acetyltransferase [Hirschia maritima]